MKRLMLGIAVACGVSMGLTAPSIAQEKVPTDPATAIVGTTDFTQEELEALFRLGAEAGETTIVFSPGNPWEIYDVGTFVPAAYTDSSGGVWGVYRLPNVSVYGWIRPDGTRLVQFGEPVEFETCGGDSFTTPDGLTVNVAVKCRAALLVL